MKDSALISSENSTKSLPECWNSSTLKHRRKRVRVPQTQMIPLKNSILWRRQMAPMVAFVLLTSGPLFGTMNEGVSLALEAAFPYVKDGFKIREDNWHGETKSGSPLLIKHQLFRGNEYWFWAATSFPNSTVTVGVFDGKGNSVSLESFSKEGKSGVRVLPNKTGTYFIRVTVNSTKHKELDWGLVYGYR
jgi:hypothetical protein